MPTDATLQPPPGFVDTPHPPIAGSDKLVSHTEEITIHRPLADVLAQVGGWTTVLSTGPIPEQRAVLRTLVERVVPVRVSYGRYTAEITWTELGKALAEMVIDQVA